MKLKLQMIDYKMIADAAQCFDANHAMNLLESRRIIICIVKSFFDKHMAKVITASQKQKQHVSVTFSDFELLAFDRVLSEYSNMPAEYLPSYSIIHQKINQACLNI